MKKYLLIFCGIFAVVILYWFFQQGQLGAILPWLIVVACPLLHLFMMKNMHSNHHTDSKDDKKPNCH